MMNNIGVLCAAAIVSAGFLAVPAEARDRSDRRCGHAVQLDSRIGASVGSIVGNAVAPNACDDAFYYDRAHFDTVHYGRPTSWRNPSTGVFGNFRINRTYQDNGYWERGVWRSSQGTYRRTMCREYTETYYRPVRFSETHVVCLDGDGSWRVVG